MGERKLTCYSTPWVEKRSQSRGLEGRESLYPELAAQLSVQFRAMACSWNFCVGVPLRTPDRPLSHPPIRNSSVSCITIAAVDCIQGSLALMSDQSLADYLLAEIL